MIAGAASHSTAPPGDTLSPREQQVAQRVAQGETTFNIANALFIAPSTVEVHRRNIMRKLNLHNVADLTRYVMSQKNYTS
jgi:two-component system NarL family response regulator